MSLSVVIKFQYHAWNKEDSDLVTLEEHKKIIDKAGKCWWSRVTTISQDKIEILNQQLRDKVETWIFLYCIAVPKSVHEDGILWFRAKLEAVTVGAPQDLSLLPEYYRTSDLGVSFLISAVEPIPYVAGKTPKVPAQASIRYSLLEGKPKPENLRSWSDGSSNLCKFPGIEPGEIEPPKISAAEPEAAPQINSDLPTVTELIAEIRELNNENRNLRSYMEFFKRFDDDFLFSSEELLESWLQSNMHRIFPELHIIDRQPHAAWSDGKFGKLDLLAFNKESKAIAIIEVKTRKRRMASGYDQFMRYTTWAKRNVDAIAKKYELGNISRESKVEFYIISDTVNEEMKAICEEYDIRLVKIMGGIGFEVVS